MEEKANESRMMKKKKKCDRKWQELNGSCRMYQKQTKINNETAEENIYKKIQAVGTCLQLKY